MSDTGVKIKLSADTSQLRSDLKLIDKEMSGLGGGKSGTSKGGATDSRIPRGDGAFHTDPVEEKRLYKEITLIRKELQKLNRSRGSASSATPPQASESQSGSGINITNVGSGGGKQLSQAVGKLAAVTAVLGIAAKALSTIKTEASSSQSGASMAYTTYGSTLAWTDYNQARKDSSNIGSPYGYNYEVVMNAGSSNMAKAGFTTKENYESDMDALLRTSKAWGIDASSLAGSSGYMASIGVTKSGDQKQFANLLAESIVDAEMTGREDEQLQVLESIAENLASVNATVSEDTLLSGLNLYNAFVANNENLKGSRGAEYANSMQSLATSRNSTLDILAGFGTEYTGIEGKLELARMAANDPEQYWKRVAEGKNQYGLSDDYFEYMLLNSGSMGIGEVEEVMKIIKAMEDGTYESSMLEGLYNTGEEATNERIENYGNDKISTEEQNEVEKMEMADDRGNVTNTITEPFKNLYNNMPDWMKQATDGVGWGIKNIVPAVFGVKGISQGLSNFKATGNIFSSGTGGGIWKDFWGKGSSATDDVVSAAANGTDEAAEGLANALSNSTDEAAEGVSKIISEGADDALNGVARAATEGLDEASEGVAKVLADSTDEAAEGVAKALSEGGDEAAEAIGNALSNSMDEAAEGAARVLSEGADEAVSAAANSADDVLGGVLGALGKVIGPAIQLGFGAYKYFTAEDDWEKSEAVGQTTGGMIGGALGSFGGPIGSILGGFVGGELGESIGNQYQDGVVNYGTGFAGDWNILGGLWRKNGTITQQKLNGTYDWSDEAVYDVDGNYAGTVAEIDKANSEAFQNWSVNNADDIDAFKRTLYSNIGEDGSVDLSFMDGVDLSTANALLKAAFGEDVFSSKKLDSMQYMMSSGSSLDDFDWGTAESNFYGNQLSGSDLITDFKDKNSSYANTSAVKDNTEAVSELTTDVSEMARWLEKNGYSGTAVWTEDKIRETYENANGIVGSSLGTNRSALNNSSASSSSSTTSSTASSANSTATGSLWTSFLRMFGISHATGNDYVPYDNYPALLHKGETVLTKFEADDYRQGKTGSTSGSSTIELNLNISGSVEGMTSENQNRIVAAVMAQINQSNLSSMLSNSFQRVQNY